MPTLTLPDGAALAWGEPAEQNYSPTVTATVNDAPAVQEEAPPAESASPTLTVTPEDVKAALDAVPHKWTATARRFAKVLGAAVVATLAAYQGNLAALIHDPTVAIAAFGTAILAAGEKFIRWKD